MNPASANPSLGALVHRLTECPDEFLRAARIGSDGVVHVDALASDVVRLMGGPMLTVQDTGELRRGRGRRPRNHLQVAMVACWLLADPWFAGRKLLAGRVLGLLVNKLAPVSGVVPAADFVTDGDRREELVRLCLEALEVLPDGEIRTQFRDRLTALDSVERLRVAEAAKAAEERARQIREAMAKKEAEEAAARYGRE